MARLRTAALEAALILTEAVCDALQDRLNQTNPDPIPTTTPPPGGDGGRTVSIERARLSRSMRRHPAGKRPS